MTHVPARPASTVVLLREAAEELEVFLMRRHRNSPVLPSVWVFPGGRCEARDHLWGRPSAEDAGDTLVRRVAGVRETFEESGFWVGPGPLPPQAVRTALDQGEASMADLWPEPVALERLSPWGRWVTPPSLKHRFDATVYVATAHEGGGVACAREMEEGRWVPAAQVLAEGLQTWPVAPPTWWTLVQLDQVGSLAGVHAALPDRDLTPVMPMALPGEGLRFALPGHPDHPAPARSDVPPLAEWTERGWRAASDSGPA